MEKILIAGATGLTGTRVVEILNRSKSFKPIALIRNEEQQEMFDDMEVDWIMGDLEEDITHTIKGIDKVIFTAGSGSKTGGDKTTAVDEEGAIKLVDAAAQAKVKKFIMLSAMNADEPTKHGELAHYLRAKAAADMYLRGSGMNYTIIRPGSLTDELGMGKVKLAAKLDARGEISRDDVAFLLVMALADPLVRNMTFEALEGDEPIKSAMINLGAS